MPNFAVPFTFPAVSRRRCGVPIRMKAAGSFKSTFDGIGKLLAASTRAPYASLRPLEACTTTPCCARHVDGSTFQRWAAAMTSMTRAVAPARRNGTYIARIAVEAPVICTPMSGLTYVLSSAGECSMTTLSTSTSSSSAISIGSEVYVPCERRVLRYAVAHLAACRQAEANDEPAANCGGGRELEKIPARRRNVHLAASLIAARMRGYVPQRQMLPAIALSISASLGLAFEASSALADMI